MTTTDLAAALLKDVPRINGDRHFLVSEVLAALSRALDPAIAERAGEVLEGVTPGPWEASFRPWPEQVGCCPLVGQPRSASHNMLNVAAANTDADIRFIAWCRNNVPALLAQNAAQETRIAGMEAEIAHWRSARDGHFNQAMKNGSTALRERSRAEAAETALAAAEAVADKLRAEVEWWKQDSAAAWDKCEERRIAQEAAEAQIAALTARVEGLTGALESIANDVDLMATGRTSLLGKMGRTARAALSTTEEGHE